MVHKIMPRCRFVSFSIFLFVIMAIFVFIRHQTSWEESVSLEDPMMRSQPAVKPEETKDQPAGKPKETKDQPAGKAEEAEDYPRRDSTICPNIGTLLANPNLPRILKSKFHPDVKVMLTQDTKTLDEPINSWWKKLQPFDNKRDFTELAEDLFTVIPGENPFSPGVCRRCAVVGTAGRLKGARQGKLIDSFDIVIRMNRSPVKGYEVDVGSKTSYHLVYPESAVGYRGAESSGKLVLFPFKVLDIEWLKSIFTTHPISKGWTHLPTNLGLKPTDAMVIHPEFIYYVAKTWLEGKGRWASAGALSVVWALHICNEVDVFGFGANKYGNWDHYYEKFSSKEKDPFRRTGVHDANIEETVRMELHKEKIIRFHPGNPA
uniref:CMP-N-acetylneuraminate-beta-galactosamide-alpha-2,3-sialyltransferase 1 n=1 Tax=Oscarella carmela TaxID=386100 RepID=A0A0F7RR30_OSCCA|nr:TPA: alpha2,3-sialyltransferase [Oscarella carmela]